MLLGPNIFMSLIFNDYNYTTKLVLCEQIYNEASIHIKLKNNISFDFVIFIEIA